MCRHWQRVQFEPCRLVPVARANHGSVFEKSVSREKNHKGLTRHDGGAVRMAGSYR